MLNTDKVMILYSIALLLRSRVKLPEMGVNIYDLTMTTRRIQFQILMI